jgi:hypothetical protein
MGSFHLVPHFEESSLGVSLSSLDHFFRASWNSFKMYENPSKHPFYLLCLVRQGYCVENHYRAYSSFKGFWSLETR